jgi:hypothetical protein
MTDYSTYHPMPFEDAKRLTDFQAQQYALERICGLLRDDIMRAAFTADEQSTLQRLIAVAQGRVSAGIMEYDSYKRDMPKPVVYGDYGV